jgi:ferrous-iron efflux pump FieF
VDLRTARTLQLASISSAALALVKFAGGLASGSMILMASAADSFADALMSALNWWGYRWSRKPADEDHPYGHGKLEGTLAVGQGMLLLGIVVSLVMTSILGLVEGRRAPLVAPAVAVLLAGGLTSGALAILLTRRSRADRSVVLEADAAHYRMDLLAALAAIGGLALVESTGWAWLDPAACLVMSMLMVRDAYGVWRRGLAEIMDEALPAEDLALVEAVLAANAERVEGFHGLRTRRAGPVRFVEVHADMRPDVTLHDAHLIVEDIGRQVREALPESRVLVHPDAHGLEDSVDDRLEAPLAQKPVAAPTEARR